MLAEGLLDEVAGLVDGGVAPTAPSMQGIGYRHLAPVVRSGAGLAAAVAAMKRDTRRYAKRQLTWFAREPGLSWIDADHADLVPALSAIEKIVERTRLFE
jgi:tRNA dimethylallyltransferase